MYDAINRGFGRGDGDIMAWINSDDMYHPYAFQTIAQVMTTYPDIHWLTGIPNAYNEAGSRCGMDLFPNAYSREFLRRGYYDVKFLPYGFNWIQQESTFWRRSLWDAIGGSLDTTKKFAADFYLWRQFAEHADMVKVYSLLGGYRCHDDQITASPETYRNELEKFADPPGGVRFFRNLLSVFPLSKRLFYTRSGGGGLFRLLGLRLGWMVGRTVRWSFPEKRWVLSLEEIM
jgi:hypothetical protein